MMLPNSKFNNPSTCLNADSHARSLPINSPIWKYYEKLEHNQNVVKCLCCHPSFESSVIPLRKSIDNLGVIWANIIGRNFSKQKRRFRITELFGAVLLNLARMEWLDAAPVRFKSQPFQPLIARLIRSRYCGSI